MLRKDTPIVRFPPRRPGFCSPECRLISLRHSGRRLRFELFQAFQEYFSEMEHCGMFSANPVHSRRIRGLNLISMMQHTVVREVSCRGIGLHSGAKVTMKLRPAPVNFGVRFRRMDLGHHPAVSTCPSCGEHLTGYQHWVQRHDGVHHRAFDGGALRQQCRQHPGRTRWSRGSHS